MIQKTNPASTPKTRKIFYGAKILIIKFDHSKKKCVVGRKQETSIQIFTEVTSLVISKLVYFTPRQTQVSLSSLT